MLQYILNERLNFVLKVTDDVPVFIGLIGVLFTALDVPRKRDLEFEKTVKIATIAAKIQLENNFVLKVVQLQELLDVRHSVFISGSADTGKTQVRPLKIGHIEFV